MTIGSYTITQVDNHYFKVTDNDLDQETIVSGGDMETLLSALFIGNTVQNNKPEVTFP